LDDQLQLIKAKLKFQYIFQVKSACLDIVLGPEQGLTNPGDLRRAIPGVIRSICTLCTRRSGRNIKLRLLVSFMFNYLYPLDTVVMHLGL